MKDDDIPRKELQKPASRVYYNKLGELATPASSVSLIRAAQTAPKVPRTLRRVIPLEHNVIG